MGLRFRKSIKICDGLRLNFGKTSASVTVGSGPFKKTFNTNGNVTTTVGLPGTGIYWTETERRGSRNSRRESAPSRTGDSRIPPQREYPVSPAVDDYFAHKDMPENPASPPAPQPAPEVPETVKGLSAEAVKRLYIYADEPIEWTELIAGATADDLLMDPVVHNYCAQMAPRILSGDVDAYLEVIERLRPVDDLALYSGDFEFGTDKPAYMEVEFVASPERVLPGGSSDDMLEEFTSAIAVRVARDLLALLPITKVLVHVVVDGNTILSVLFERGKLGKVNFRNTTAREIIHCFSYLAVGQNQPLHEVGRIHVE